jgi:hypothetical protein
MKRKAFLHYSLSGAAGILLPGSMLAQVSPTPPALPPEKVKEFVGAGHNNLARVKEMLAETPALIYAAWDWGGGDFETALEGAGHVGNKEIANYLIEKGSRTNLFVLTMLGNTSLVKEWLELYPQYLTARGAHGFTLLHHAQRGGEAARELADYLLQKGLKDTRLAL